MVFVEVFDQFSVVALAGCMSYSPGLPHTLTDLFLNPKSLAHSATLLLFPDLNQLMAALIFVVVGIIWNQL